MLSAEVVLGEEKLMDQLQFQLEEGGRCAISLLCQVRMNPRRRCGLRYASFTVMMKALR
jgi:hypothetical protein